MHKLILFFITLFISFSAFPCTTAVVSGRATTDGRPLLLKNRDADALQNRLVYFDGKFKFVGLVNSNDKSNSEVWIGFNNAGFAIMNSASYNLKGDDTTKFADNEGRLMKQALETCATLKDFEVMLSSLKKPLGVEANFGVIDAAGGAAYYEVNNFHFIKFDVNDPSVAPNGYLIRTNYSFAGINNKGMGYIRYSTAENLFHEELSKGRISCEFLINNVPRCLTHSFTKEDLLSNLPDNINDTTYVFFRDYIPRYLSSAAVSVQGVKENESPALTTMWSIVGFPLTSLIVPVWILEDGTLPEVLIADETGNAPLCTKALQLKSKVFPVQNDAKENYLNLAALMNKENTGIRQQLIPIETEILKRSKLLLDEWRNIGIKETEVKEFYFWVDSLITEKMKLSDRYSGT